MPRRKQEEPHPVAVVISFAIMISIGAIICIVTDIFPVGGVITLFVTWGSIALMIWKDSSDKANYTAEAREIARRAVRDHIEELGRRHLSLVRVDHYGVKIDGQWKSEWEHFWNNVILPSLNIYQRTYMEKDLVTASGTLFKNELQERVAEKSRDLQKKLTFHDEITPLEFEMWCKDALADAGWSARTTKGSGDQGADVLAEKHGVRLVIQCKLYSKAVGNKAVQEAYAAMQHYRVDRAVVVTNNGYTNAAKQLSNTTGVLLLHLSDLSRIDELLGRSASRN